MLGEALSTEAPELHRDAERMFRYGNAWIRQRSSWLEACGIAFTNVLNLRPPGNKLGQLCGKTKDFGHAYTLPPLGRSGPDFPLGPHLRPEYLPELSRLFTELSQTRPNVIVACGNTACWAVLKATNIGSIRGNVAESVEIDSKEKIKVLPTYHPAGVLRQWSWRPIVVADLMKAWREAQFAELRRPTREVLINPSISEVLEWTRQTLATPPPLLAADIETGAGQIKCIGFARSRGEALVVPFVDLQHPSGSYWPTRGAELSAWAAVRALLESSIPKVFQNGLYDLQYIFRMGLRPQACLEDTMLLHHSLFPEMLKGLGFLGSIYTQESSWKLMRRPRADTEKRDE